jgi:hypothetical protein
VTRLLTSPLFWMLTLVLGWLVVVTLLIANGAGAAPADAGIR